MRTSAKIEVFIMRIKKLTAFFIAALLALSVLAGCAGGDKPADTTKASLTTTASGAETEIPEEDVTIRIGGMTGPTSMGLVKVMEDNSAGNASNKYEFTIAGTADELTPKLIQGELDIAAVPANLASVLYNNTKGKVQLLAINTLGVLYIVNKGESVASVADLKGKTVYSTGKGTTPEFTLRYILSENGIDPDRDVKIEYKSEAAEVVALIKQAGSGIAMLPQPYVTIAQSSVEGLNIALDMTEEWNRVNPETQMLTGTLVVRREFAEKYPQAIARFLEEYRASTEYVNTNVSDAAQLIEKFGIFKAAIAEGAIPYCNITFIAGPEMKPLMTGYLTVLFSQKPAAIGGDIPEDNFYYGK